MDLDLPNEIKLRILIHIPYEYLRHLRRIFNQWIDAKFWLKKSKKEFGISKSRFYISIPGMTPEHRYLSLLSSRKILPEMTTLGPVSLMTIGSCFHSAISYGNLRTVQFLLDKYPKNLNLVGEVSRKMDNPKITNWLITKGIETTFDCCVTLRKPYGGAYNRRLSEITYEELSLLNGLSSPSSTKLAHILKSSDPQVYRWVLNRLPNTFISMEPIFNMACKLRNIEIFDRVTECMYNLAGYRNLQDSLNNPDFKELYLAGFIASGDWNLIGKIAKFLSNFEAGGKIKLTFKQLNKLAIVQPQDAQLRLKVIRKYFDLSECRRYSHLLIATGDFDLISCLPEIDDWAVKEAMRQGYPLLYFYLLEKRGIIPEEAPDSLFFDYLEWYKCIKRSQIN